MGISPDIVDLGPELFASKDLKVLNFKGENYYLACGDKVADLPGGGTSSCVKPSEHPHWEHEDYEGRCRDTHFGTPVPLNMAVRQHAKEILRLTGLNEDQIFNALNALQHAGFVLTKEP